MQSAPDGWHVLNTAQAGAGSRYQFVLPDGARVPDPASRYQPDDVHGASEVIDPLAYAWRDQSWRGRPWHEAVIYELHVGAFTGAGSFRAVIERLDHLVQLGVNTLELMPLADFPGRYDWGYDGTCLFAPDASYGRPEDLKALIDEAHARQLSVVLDVVYNHFGPEGNYLSLYAPQFFNAQHHTPWGAAINFDADGSRTVREFFIHNALYWLQEFHIDGLRFDAVHAIIDDSPLHILDELAQRVRAAGLSRQSHLILENEHNSAHWLARDGQGRPQRYDAQWNDDVHHVLHVAGTGESEGYYADYGAHDTTQLARALAQGFAFQGEHMPYRGSERGESSAHLPPSAFVAFLQNHDQIGNRALGERLSELAEPAALRAVTATYLLLPQIPMLFMGEEWHSRQPFLFFCDFGAELAQAVRDGRRQEFARFAAFADERARARIPDPQSPQTFANSKLDWQCATEPSHALILQWYRQLLALRRQAIVPLLPQLQRAGHYQVLAPGALVVRWRADSGAELRLDANLSPRATAGFAHPAAQPLWQEGESLAPDTLSAWSVRWLLSAPP